MLDDVALVRRWEQRGCGRSDRAGPYSIARFVADLEFLREHWGHEQWIVAGHSLGAGLALRYAMTHPDRTLGLLYISGTGVGHQWRSEYHQEADRRLTPAQRRRREELKDRERTTAEEHEWRTLCYAPDFGDRERAFSLAAQMAAAPYNINFECNAALNAEEKATHGLLSACWRLPMPVRVVHGAGDPRPVWAVEPMVAALPDSALAILDDVGHLPWLEAPDVFGTLVRDLVRSLIHR